MSVADFLARIEKYPRLWELCSGLIAPDTLIRDNTNRLLRCQNESETSIQAVF